jgi:small subunit ribosomal protein S1
MTEEANKPTDTEKTEQPSDNKEVTEGKIEFQVEQLGEDDLRALYDRASGGIEEGKVISGKILSLDREGAVVDIGYKSEGIIPMSEFGSDIEDYSVGDTVDVLLEEKENVEGLVVLSKIKAERQKRWEKTIANSNEGDIVEGRIIRKVRGGLIVDIGMDAFLPASQIDIKHVSRVEEHLGKTYKFRILKINLERKNVVVSRREILEEERAQNRAELLENIEVGQLREGMVKNITDFGAFIDLNGLDGLLHITDMTWGRISHPSEVLSIGDKVEVMVLDFDRERQRIALGLKQKEPNPWDNIEQKYPVGSIVKGRIVNLLPYGAFIEIEKGVEGLIHISEISWTKRIGDPSEVLSVGDIVEAMVLNIKKDEAKISLGIKQTEFNPWSVVEEKYPAGTKIKGKVRNVTSYGAFIEIEEGIDGLIHVSDMSWTKKINHPTEIVKKGDEVEAIIISVDQEAKKITLGLKQLQENPWDKIDELFNLGEAVECTVERLAEYGVFVSLPHDMESLIHISQLSDKPVQNVDQVARKGDKLTAKVVKIDHENKKIILSVREYLNDLKAAEEEGEKEIEQATESQGLPSEILPSPIATEIDKALQQMPSTQTEDVEAPSEETQVETSEEPPVSEEAAPAAEAPPETQEESAATAEPTPTEERPVETTEETPVEQAPSEEEAVPVGETPEEEGSMKEEPTPVVEAQPEEAPPAEEVTPIEEAPPREEAIPVEEAQAEPAEAAVPEAHSEEVPEAEKPKEGPEAAAESPEAPSEETPADEDESKAQTEGDSEEQEKTGE